MKKIYLKKININNMKNLVESLLDVDNNIKNLDKNILLKDYENFLKDAKCLEDFSMDEINPRGIADPEFTEYSAKAKRSLNTAGKKYFKLLQKLLKPKFLRKTDRTIQDIYDEFMSTDYFVEEAWEWAPNARTDLWYDQIWWDCQDWWENIAEYFGEELE